MAHGTSCARTLFTLPKVIMKTRFKFLRRNSSVKYLYVANVCQFVKVAFTQRRITRRKMVVCMLKKILCNGEMDNPSVYYTA